MHVDNCPFKQTAFPESESIFWGFKIILQQWIQAFFMCYWSGNSNRLKKILPGQITAVIIKFSFYYQFASRFRQLKKKKNRIWALTNQYPHSDNILTTVNLLQCCHLQNFPISSKPVPPSPVITGDSVQISCGQTARARCDVVARITAMLFLTFACAGTALTSLFIGRRLPR